MRKRNHLRPVEEDDRADGNGDFLIFGSPRDPSPPKDERNKHRHLRSYERVAQKNHHCDKCHQLISPGDLYQGTVEITYNGHFAVWKEHVAPSCDWPPDPDEEDRERREQTEAESAAA